MSESPLQDDRSGAVLSDDREYRYRLWRTWDAEKPTLAWLMLNPSTADETDDDQTIRRCIDYAKRWGYGTIVVGNLFALRATDPDELRDHPAPIGPANDDHLERICHESETVVAAWGNHGDYGGRAAEVEDQFAEDLYALRINQTGQPAHPSRLPADEGLIEFSRPGDGGESA